MYFFLAVHSLLGETMNRTMNIRLEDEQKEEKKPEMADPLAEKFLKTRQILMSGEVSEELADKICRQLLILEADKLGFSGKYPIGKVTVRSDCVIFIPTKSLPFCAVFREIWISLCRGY